MRLREKLKNLQQVQQSFLYNINPFNLTPPRNEQKDAETLKINLGVLLNAAKNFKKATEIFIQAEEELVSALPLFVSESENTAVAEYVKLLDHYASSQKTLLDRVQTIMCDPISKMEKEVDVNFFLSSTTF